MDKRPVAKTSKSSEVKRAAAKTESQQTIANDMSGTKAGTVRRAKTGQSYINNKLFTASSEKERKICASGVRLTKNTEEEGTSLNGFIDIRKVQ